MIPRNWYVSSLCKDTNICKSRHRNMTWFTKTSCLKKKSSKYSKYLVTQHQSPLPSLAAYSCFPEDVWDLHWGPSLAGWERHQGWEHQLSFSCSLMDWATSLLMKHSKTFIFCTYILKKNEYISGRWPCIHLNDRWVSGREERLGLFSLRLTQQPVEQVRLLTPKGN